MIQRCEIERYDQAPRLRKSNHAIDCAFSRCRSGRIAGARGGAGVRHQRRTGLLRSRHLQSQERRRSVVRHSDQARQAVARAAGSNVFQSRHHPGESRRTRQSDRRSERRHRLGSGLGARARESRQRLLPIQPAQRSGRRIQPGDHVVTRRAGTGVLQPRQVAPRTRRDRRGEQGFPAGRHARAGNLQ